MTHRCNEPTGGRGAPNNWFPNLNSRFETNQCKILLMKIDKIFFVVTVNTIILILRQY